MAEYTPWGVAMMKERQQQQDLDRLKWHDKNNEYLHDKSMQIKANTSACLKHMRLSQQERCAQVKYIMRSADPFGRFERLGSVRDVMFPVGHSEKYKKNSKGLHEYDMSHSTYLKHRLSLDPSEKYAVPPTSSMRYGWLVKEKAALLDSVMSGKTSKYGRKHYPY